MKIAERLYPGLLASETFFPILQEETELLNRVKEVTADGFYGRIEISSMKSVSGQRTLLEISEKIPVTQWITNDLNALDLNPSAVDSGLRKKTVRKMKELVDIAAKSGADRVAIISCQDPGEQWRSEAAKSLTETMCTVAEYASQYGIVLMLEPLDRGAHKNNFIGPTREAVEIMKNVHAICQNVLISWDSAHVALNQENVMRSLEQSFAYVGQIHLANAVLDRSSDAYGDWHMPMGEPGFLTAPVATDLARCACQRLGDRKMAITVECRSPDADAMMYYEHANRMFLRNILEQEVNVG